MKQELIVNTITPAKYFGKLFEARDVIHLSHLAAIAKTFSNHVILDEFYKEILEKTDEIIETYQGMEGIVDITIPSSTKQEPIPYLQELLKQTIQVRNSFKSKGIQAIVDEIEVMILQTLYKLINLK